MRQGIKLSTWAKNNGFTYKGAYRILKSGKFPCQYTQLETGTIIVYPDVNVNTDKAALYARVSSNDQKDDLERQLQRLRDFASSNGYTVVKEIKEIGSGLNGRRKKLIKLLKDKDIPCIVIEHKDRLTRFGFDYINAATDKKFIIINEEEYKDDLTQDFVDIVTSMCARIYGKRSAKNRAKKAIKAASDEN